MKSQKTGQSKGNTHIAKIKMNKIAKHIPKFLIYGGKMLGECVETLKKNFYRCPFLQSQAK